MAGQTANANQYSRGHSSFGNASYSSGGGVFWGSEANQFAQSYAGHIAANTYTTTNRSEIFGLYNTYAVLNGFSPVSDSLVSVGNLITVDAGPSSDSFNFISKGDSNWQQAAVENIHFYIALFDAKHNISLRNISFPQAILFGTPTLLNKGNTGVDPKTAAYLSAKALKYSMEAAVNKYGDTAVPAITVSSYFRERLIHNYPLFIPGGRVNFNANSYNVVPTQYKANWFFDD